MSAVSSESFYIVFDNTNVQQASYHWKTTRDLLDEGVVFFGAVAAELFFNDNGRKTESPFKFTKVPSVKGITLSELIKSKMSWLLFLSCSRHLYMHWNHRASQAILTTSGRGSSSAVNCLASALPISSKCLLDRVSIPRRDRKVGFSAGAMSEWR